MSLVSKTIPGFTGGVSQQAPAVRINTQCELLENGYPSLVRGLIKRPPVEHLASLSTNAATNTLVHTINRDASEQYQAVFTGNASDPIEVFKLDGTKCTVRYGDLDESLNYTARSAVKNYAAVSNPLNALRAVTVADYTLVTNNTKTCAMSSTLSGTWTNEAILFVKKGNPTCTYRVWLNGIKVGEYSTMDTSNPSTYKTSVIAANLYADISAATDASLMIKHGSYNTWTPSTYTVTLDGTYSVSVSWTPNPDPYRSIINAAAAAKELEADLKSVLPLAWTVTRAGTTVYVRKTDGSAFTRSVTGQTNGLTITAPTGAAEWQVDYITDRSVIRIRRYNGEDFSFKAEDTFDSGSIVAIKEYIQSMTDLPPTAWDNFICQVVGEANEKADDFWVKYTDDGGKKTGIWKETVKPGLKNTFDKDTMPHRLVRTGINEFTFAPILWDERTVGDDDTASAPSFIGSQIRDIFFYRNRLGFLSGENVILSKAGDFFNFWPTTLTEVLDDDPIDVAVSANQVAVLNHAVPFAKNLALFGTQLQFNLGSGDNNLTPKTVAVDPTTYYTCSETCRPVGLGNTIYFPSPKGEFAAIREYFVDPTTLVNEAADVTAHAPEYLPSGVVQMAGNDTLSTVFILTEEEPKSLYVYKYYWAGDEKKQSAWGKWTFGFDILGIGVIDSYLYMVTKRGSGTALQRINLEPKTTGSLNYTVHLDQLKALTGTYSSQTGKTTWTLPYDRLEDPVVPPYGGRTLPVCCVRGDTGMEIFLTAGSALNKVEAVGDFSGITCYLGETYMHRYRFSPWMVDAPNTNVADLSIKLKFRSVTVGYLDTGYFRLLWQAPQRSANTKEWTGVLLGQAPMNEVTLHTGKHRFIVMGDATNTTVDLLNDSHLPSAFQIASFEGTAVGRTQSL